MTALIVWGVIIVIVVPGLLRAAYLINHDSGQRAEPRSPFLAAPPRPLALPCYGPVYEPLRQPDKLDRLVAAMNLPGPVEQTEQVRADGVDERRAGEPTNRSMGNWPMPGKVDQLADLYQGVSDEPVTLGYLRVMRYAARFLFCDLDQLDAEVEADRQRVLEGVLT